MFTDLKRFPHDWKTITTNHHFYFHAIEKLKNQFDSNKKELAEKIYSADVTVRNSSLFELDYLSNTSIILCGCFIESALNFIGVCLLGEKMYNETAEKLPAIDKIKLLHVLSKRSIPGGCDNDFRLIKDLNRKRNELVHPKSKEKTSGMRPVHEAIPNCENDVQLSIDAREAMARFADDIFPGFKPKA